METFEYWVSIDLSSKQGSISIHRSDPLKGIELLLERNLPQPSNHSEQLLDELGETFKNTGLSIGQVSRWITCSGPGSFTGLRIAYSALKGIVTITNATLETVDGSEALAFHLLGNHKKVSVLTTMTSQKIACATFENLGGSCRRISFDVKHPDSFTEPPTEFTVGDERSAALIKAFSPEVHSLKASYLGQALMQSESRSSAASIAEMIKLSPNYVGDSKFNRKGLH